MLRLSLIPLILAAPLWAEEFTVTMQGMQYSPATLTAAVGDTIRFVNDNGTDHNVLVVTAGHALDLGKQEPGQESVMILHRPGNFEVECVFHDVMQLAVEVE